MNLFQFFAILVLITLHSYTSIGQSEYQKAWKVCNELGHIESMECMLGKPIFDFEGETIKNEKVNIAALKGKVVIINFWFMTCAPCMAELKGLNEIVDKYKDQEVEFISFTTDTKEDLEIDFFPYHEFKFKIIPVEAADVYKHFGIRWGFPTTMVVDREGLIQLLFSGGEIDEEVANKEIKRKLIPEINKGLK